jgi:VIT1/CCC1 family predicted Fe2+/Mn2+ transporter
MPPKEQHRTQRTGWLRASVLGANDGVISTASLLLGVAAAHTAHSGIMIAGVSGLVAGALAMAAGEYVSVSSQADTELADLALERKGLEANETFEHEELAAIYVKRGLELRLAKEVAEQLMAHDALAAHARDELGISDTLAARPLQAALASAISFVVGGAVPLLTAVVAPEATLPFFVGGLSLAFLPVLGGLAARAGGASVTVGAVRVLFWGALAMGLTAEAGALFGGTPFEDGQIIPSHAPQNFQWSDAVLPKLAHGNVPMPFGLNELNPGPQACLSDSCQAFSTLTCSNALNLSDTFSITQFPETGKHSREQKPCCPRQKNHACVNLGPSACKKIRH